MQFKSTKLPSTPTLSLLPVELTQDSTGAFHLKQYLQEKIRIKTMAFINRWNISQNWERNANVSDSAI